MLKFTISPFDVLFFGDSRPFDKGSDAFSIFPPFPHTLASSIFARLYSLKGIQYNDVPLINNVYGPFIEKDNKIYLPCPMDIVIDKNFNTIKVLDLLSNTSTGKSLIYYIITDLEDVSDFLWFKGELNKDIKPFNGFISFNGLKKWYEGENLDKTDFIKFNDIYDSDERIGIRIDHKKGTTDEEDGLYRVFFIRLKNGFYFVLWVDFNIDNLKSNFNKEEELLEFYNTNPRILKLGGESRSVYYTCQIDNFKNMFVGFSSKNDNHHKILFLTPGIFKTEKNTIPIFLNNFKTGITGKYKIASINQKRNLTQITVRSLPAGSVIYLDKSVQLNTPIDFYQQDPNYLGSNLVLNL